ncbi:hypothetical protein [Alkalicoccobacillus porphyridii]|uniref:DUF2628 domain-containing protein n=1 Tax=Alkalicoccobacillus porphyridii TaxID=2597270 RepID=A0A554A0W3_9BACI|nr:hypothetical protein [Alkalicoccobacillus porphyridii]TSB47328.1 hypothetical protein FN960_06205 [Alkalicoccobacillus porphyridii]
MTSEPVRDADVEDVPVSEEEALKLYVGDKYNYYQKKWAIGEDGKPKLLSFNVGGFFGTFWWAAGRSMYLFATYFFCLVIGADLLFLLTDIALWEGVSFGLIGLVVYGLFGNHTYHHYATKKARKMLAENRSRKEIMDAGGFLWRRFFACLGIYFLYASFSLFVLGIE